MGEHYYGPNGEERYDATMRDVRSDHLVPSVTTVLNVVNKPGLNFWQQNKIYNTLLDNMSLMAEYERDEFIKHIKEKIAADLEEFSIAGTKIHQGVADFFNGKESDLPAATIDALESLQTNYKLEPLDIEHSFSNYDLGFGGKIDWVGDVDGEFSIIDWKTKDTVNGKGYRLYDEVPMQLAACANGIWKPEAKLYTVVLSRTEPEYVSEPVLWKHNEKYYKAFQSAQLLWCAMKNYNPWTGGKWYE